MSSYCQIFHLYIQDLHFSLRHSILLSNCRFLYTQLLYFDFSLFPAIFLGEYTRTSLSLFLLTLSILLSCNAFTSITYSFSIPISSRLFHLSFLSNPSLLYSLPLSLVLLTHFYLTFPVLSFSHLNTASLYLHLSLRLSASLSFAILPIYMQPYYFRLSLPTLRPLWLSSEGAALLDPSLSTTRHTDSTPLLSL